MYLFASNWKKGYNKELIKRKNVCENVRLLEYFSDSRVFVSCYFLGIPYTAVSIRVGLSRLAPLFLFFNTETTQSASESPPIDDGTVQGCNVIGRVLTTGPVIYLLPIGSIPPPFLFLFFFYCPIATETRYCTRSCHQVALQMS